MTSPINGNVEIHEIDVEETFKKVLNTDGRMPSQILSIKEEDHCGRLVAIDFSCMKRIQKYGLLVEEAQRLDRELYCRDKGSCGHCWGYYWHCMWCEYWYGGRKCS